MFGGLSIGFSPAMTPDGNGLLGMFGMGSEDEEKDGNGDAKGRGGMVVDNVTPSDVILESNNGYKTGHIGNGGKLQQMDESMMIERRIEDEWWANYVDFGDGEPVSAR